MKEWSDHKINANIEVSTLENPYIDTLFNLPNEFNFFNYFYILELST